MRDHPRTFWMRQRSKAPGPIDVRQQGLHEPALSSACQAGMVNNLNDGLAWGLFPLLFASAGVSVGRIGVLAALYPAVWGIGQLGTGALSDRVGRKKLIVAGMLIQALALALVAVGDAFAVWALAAVLLGAGTAMVYPTLLAAVGDVAHPAWRARAVGIYRLWRDGGFAVGAVLSGVVADLWGVRPRHGPSRCSPPHPGYSWRHECTRHGDRPATSRGYARGTPARVNAPRGLP